MTYLSRFSGAEVVVGPGSRAGSCHQPGGDLLVELTGHGNSVNDIDFRQSPGPELLLASAGDRTVRLWNLTGRLP
jgi:WD40 repeat protein